jgi:hypothetical protein
MLHRFEDVRPVPAGEVRDAGFQGTDETSHKVSRPAEWCCTRAEELSQGEPHNLGRLSLHLPRGAFQASAEVIGQADGKLG